MSKQDTTAVLVTGPLTLDDYIAQHAKTHDAGGSCTGCFKGPAVAGDGTNLYCRACWAGMRGHDEAADMMVRAIIGAAVTAAADAGADEELVRAAVDQALSERRAERDDEPVTYDEWRAAVERRDAAA